MRASRISVVIALLSLYVGLLLVAAITLPLRLDEILQIAVPHPLSFPALLHWVARTPGGAPLNYFLQFPLISISGPSREMVRLVSMLFAVGACLVFWRLARNLELKWPYAATVVFALFPSHYLLATTGRPAEQALFFLILATSAFFRLMKAPGVIAGALYALWLTVCLYTQPFFYLPAVGYLLFYLRFVNQAPQRRAFWFALPATAVPALLYFPYYLWATPYGQGRWLFEPGLPAPLYLQIFGQLSGGTGIGYALSGILILGAILALWLSLTRTQSSLFRNIELFCLFGGFASTLSAVAVLKGLSVYTVTPADLLGAIPAAILLSFAGLEATVRSRFGRVPVFALAGALLLLSLIADLMLLKNRRAVDIQAQANAVVTKLAAHDSCVVFVSEGLSRNLFLLFQPQLGNRECLNFFHARIVLAIHHYVRPNEQRDAGTFFRGLNFVELERIHVGGGQIVVLRQPS